MTASFQSSFFAPLSEVSRPRRRANRFNPTLFQVDVENFDNEVESYEIEASSAAEAAEIAESRFGGDVYNMNVYALPGY